MLVERGPVLLVPGFTQTASSWSAAASAVERTCPVRVVEVPEPRGFAATAHAIGDAGGRGVYAGYSMGGRLCLRLALDRPDLVRGLVLVSSTPGIEDAAERAARVESDERWAALAERDVDGFLEQWLAQPMFTTVPADAPGLDDRRSLEPAFLAACLRQLGTGAMEPMWDRLPDLAMPVLLVTGTRDEKFTAIARRMLERLASGAEYRELPAGHALPLEQPEALGRLIGEFASQAQIRGPGQS